MVEDIVAGTYACVMIRGRNVAFSGVWRHRPCIKILYALCTIPGYQIPLPGHQAIEEQDTKLQPYASILFPPVDNSLVVCSCRSSSLPYMTTRDAHIVQFLTRH